MPHSPGRFVWRERVTTDGKRARAFYSELLGWTWDEMRSIDGPYFLAHVERTPVGGLWQPPAGVTMPVAWNSYLSVDDVDRTTTRAREMGWKVFRPPTDIPGIGRFSVLGDFAGAGVLPYRNLTEDPVPGPVPPGAFCWETLVTSDVPRALREYGTLFGWRKQVSPNGEVPIFAVDDTLDGQVGDIQQAAGGTPPRWIPYVRVLDARRTASRVTELGGRVVVPGIDIPEVGTIAFLVDPGGAELGLFQKA